MDCNDYRDLRPVHGSLPLPKAIWDTPEHEAWTDHLDECPGCSDWELSCRIIERGFDPADFPCVHIADQVTQRCDKHPDPHDCPDVLVVSIPSEGYGIPIRDGGTSYSLIQYCPWCGVTIAKELAVRFPVDFRTP